MPPTALDVTYVFKARHTLLTQLHLQGFETGDYAGTTMQDTALLVEGDEQDMFVSKRADYDGGVVASKAFVRFHPLSKTLRPANVRDIADQAFGHDGVLGPEDTLYIVCRDEPSDSLYKALRDLWAQERQLVCILAIKRLQFNVLDHKLQPKHTPLTDEQAAAVRQRYGVRGDSELADMGRFSPVSQAIGLRPGQLCRIDRPSPTAITCEFYRICSP